MPESLTTSHFSEKQIELIEKAEQLFAEKGFDATSVRDLASFAEVNVSMVSYYFGSKEKLLEAIFEYRFITSRLFLQKIVTEENLSPFEKIKVFVDYQVERQMKNKNFFVLYTREQLKHQDTVLGQQILQFKLRNNDLVNTLISEGQVQKAFKPDCDVPFIMNIVFGILLNTISTRHHYKVLKGLDKMSNEAFDKYLSDKLKTHIYDILHNLLKK